MSKIRIGLLGSGGIGNVHARHYQALSDVELFVFDIDPEKSKTVAERWGATPVQDEESFWRQIDAVDICLPSFLHHQFGMKAIGLGKAVMIEKPIAQNLEQASELVQTADRSSIPLFVGHVVRFFPEFKNAHRIVTNGQIGRPGAIRMRRGGAAPRSNAEWFFDHAKSGGVLMDLAIHDFDWLRWTFGEVKHLYSRSVAAKAGVGVDYALTTLTFESGAVAHTETTWMDPAGFRVTFEVCGSEGMIEFDSRNVQTLRIATTDQKGQEAPLAQADDPYYNELKAFVRHLQTGEELPIKPYDAYMALSISLAAIESAKSDKVVVPTRSL